MRRIVILILFLIVTAGSARGEVLGTPVDYSAGGTTLKGYLAYDNNFTGRRPGVLVVHEWWGHNEYARRRARMLAELGYVALAVDMYGDGKQASHPDDAGKFSGEIKKNMALGRQRFGAAMKVLKGDTHTDPKRIGAVGYCFGGGVVLQMARDGIDLDGVASFHGGLSTTAPAKKGAVKAKVLVLNGGSDSFITPEQIEGFKKEMSGAGADFRFISYPGALHSFTNPDADSFAKKFKIPLGYNPEADKKSWEEMKKFFHNVFSK